MINYQILPYPEVKSLNKECKSLVVLLHGLGSDGNDLIDLVSFIAKELPDCHFISPHGVEKFDNAPYGRQWFSLNDRKPQVIQKLVANNSNSVAEIIQKKQEELNLANKNTIIIGFSQGTMMGLYLNLIQNDPFAAMIGFSGKLIAPAECINKTTPVCAIHGEMDDVVEISSIDEITRYLEQHNITHSIYKIPNLRHSIDHRGLQLAVQFINEFTFLKTSN